MQLRVAERDYATEEINQRDYAMTKGWYNKQVNYTVTSTPVAFAAVVVVAVHSVVSEPVAVVAASPMV